MCCEFFGPRVSNRSPFEHLPVTDIEHDLIGLEGRSHVFQLVLPLEAVHFERPVQAAGRGLAWRLLRHIREQLRAVAIDFERQVSDPQDAGHEDSSAAIETGRTQILILCADEGS